MDVLGNPSGKSSVDNQLIIGVVVAAAVWYLFFYEGGKSFELFRSLTPKAHHHSTPVERQYVHHTPVQARAHEIVGASEVPEYAPAVTLA